MVYQNKLVASIRSNGKFVKEFGDKVYLPYNSDYSIFIKNLNTRRAIVKISIDGEDVLSGRSLVINPNSTFELEGFLLPNNTVKNKFRFIKKTEKISEYRGDRIDDGLIRIEYQFEEPQHYYVTNTIWVYNTPQYHIVPLSDSVGVSNCAVNCCVTSESGITTKGAETHQTFNETYVGNVLSEPNVLIIQLLGEYKDKPISKTIKSREKVKCPICGTKSKAGTKYCSECATYIYDLAFE